MLKCTTALLALLPFVTGAQERDLFFQFDGTVSGVQGCITCVSVREGDVYHGVLRIHSAIAGLDPTRTHGDRDPSPSVGEYGNWPDWEEPAYWDFVTGFNPSQGVSQDAVLVRDQRGSGMTGAGSDFYGARDAKDWGTPQFAAVSLGMQTTRNVIFGDGVEQAFDVEPQGNERFFAAIYRGIGKFASEVYLNVTRMTLTPGRCRP